MWIPCVTMNVSKHHYKLYSTLHDNRIKKKKTLPSHSQTHRVVVCETILYMETSNNKDVLYIYDTLNIVYFFEKRVKNISKIRLFMPMPQALLCTENNIQFFVYFAEHWKWVYILKGRKKTKVSAQVIPFFYKREQIQQHYTTYHGQQNSQQNN